MCCHAWRPDETLDRLVDARPARCSAAPGVVRPDARGDREGARCAHRRAGRPRDVGPVHRPRGRRGRRRRRRRPGDPLAQGASSRAGPSSRRTKRTSRTRSSPGSPSDGRRSALAVRGLRPDPGVRARLRPEQRRRRARGDGPEATPTPSGPCTECDDRGRRRSSSTRTRSSVAAGKPITVDVHEQRHRRAAQLHGVEVGGRRRAGHSRSRRPARCRGGAGREVHGARRRARTWYFDCTVHPTSMKGEIVPE